MRTDAQGMPGTAATARLGELVRWEQGDILTALCMLARGDSSASEALSYAPVLLRPRDKHEGESDEDAGVEAIRIARGLLRAYKRVADGGCRVRRVLEAGAGTEPSTPSLSGPQALAHALRCARAWESHGWVSAAPLPVLDPIASSDCRIDRLLGYDCMPAACRAADKAVLRELVSEGWTQADVASVAAGVALPILDALHRLSTRPPQGLPPLAYALMQASRNALCSRPRRSSTCAALST